MGCSLPGSSVLGVSQPRKLKWAAISSGDLPNPGIKPRSPTLQADSLQSQSPGKPYIMHKWSHSVVSDSLRPHGLYSPPGSSIHRIFQARVLERVVISFSRGSSQPRDWTQVSRIAGRHFTVWVTREVPCYSQLTTIGRQKKAVSESRDAKEEVKRVKKRRWYYRFLNRLPFPWLSAMGRLGWFQVLNSIFLLI